MQSLQAEAKLALSCLNNVPALLLIWFTTFTNVSHLTGSRFPSSCHKSVRSAKTRSAVCGRRTRRTNAAWRGRTKVRRRHSSQKALEKVDTRMRNVRPPVHPQSVRPPVGVFLFAVGPMTAIEISDLIRFEEGREERNAQCRGILQRSRVPLVSAPRERPGSKASEKELDSSWGQTLNEGKKGSLLPLFSSPRLSCRSLGSLARCGSGGHGSFDWIKR